MSGVDWLRLYLLGGLVLHKVVWEVLKRRQGAQAGRSEKQSPKLLVVKAVKVGILLAIIAQTLVPDFLPIVPDPGALRVWGAAIYTAGLAIAITGRLQLGGNWLDIEAAGVLERQRVVDGGLYRYIRHPIYSGDLLLLLGLELALNSWCVLLAILLAPPVMLKAIAEERMLARTLPGYSEYCRRTKRFIPFLA